jgi:hypothetical protein
MQTAVIKEYTIEPHPADIASYCIKGKVYGHPKFEDGAEVITPGIKKVITHNTEYTLE